MNKKVLAVAVSSALATPMAAHAVKYKLSGQVNRAMVYQSDSDRTDIQFVDNISSGTRWRLTGSEDIGNGMKVGFNWEWQNSQNPGSGGAPIGSGDFGEAETMRKAEVWFSGGWGKVSLGQGDGAGNGTTEVDLSDTWNVAYTGRSSFGAAVAFQFSGTTTGGSTFDTTGSTALDQSAAAALAPITHGATFSHFDAFSRYDRIRYDSPALGPVTLAVSAGARDKYEGALRWSQGIGGGQISAGLFYGSHSSGGVKNRYGGSIAYLFSFGTNLQFAYAENEPSATGSTKGKNWYLKVGHKWGNNAVSLGYGESKDVAAGALATAGLGDGTGWKNKGFNIGFNHNIPKAKVDLYAGAAFNQLDTGNLAGSGLTALDADDIITVTVGTKLKFD
jgi:predicted porin